MKIRNNQVVLALAISFIIVFTFATLTVTAFAEDLTSGYVIAKGGGETCIKWSLTEIGDGMTLSFTIDSAAKDKMQTTVLYGCNASGSVQGYDGGKNMAW